MAANKSFIEKQSELEARRKKLAEDIARLKAAEKERQRKRDTEQRLIVGRAVIEHAQKNPDFARQIAGILDAGVTRADERKTVADLMSPSDATNDNQTAVPGEPAGA